MSNDPKKILAIKLRNLSNIALWTSALATLQKAYPEAEIEIMVPEGSGALLKNESYVKRIHLVKPNSTMDLIRTLWSLRKEKYDLTLGFHASRSLSRLIWLLRAKKVGLHRHDLQKKPFWSHLRPPAPGQNEDLLKKDNQLMLALGIERSISMPKLTVNPILLSQAAVRLNMIEDGKFRLVLLPGAKEETSRYPKAKWLEAMELLKKEKNLIVSMIVDKNLSEEWGLRTECFKRGIKLYDDLSLEMLVAYLSHFDGAVAMDSAPMHIAQAVGLKTISLFGPSSVGESHAYDKNRHPLLRMDVPCRPFGPRDQENFQYCSLKKCGHLTCLASITSEMLLEKVRMIAKNHSSSGAKRVPGAASMS